MTDRLQISIAAACGAAGPDLLRGPAQATADFALALDLDHRLQSFGASRCPTMSYCTYSRLILLAVYPSRTEAEQALRAARGSGIPSHNIRVSGAEISVLLDGGASDAKIKASVANRQDVGAALPT
jgi:hypothetical protein